MVPFDETPESEEEDDDFPAPDLGALLGGGSGSGDDNPEEDRLATDSLDALRDQELTPAGASTSDLAVDPAKAAIIEATGEDDEDDDIEDLEELERDGFGRERDFGFDSIDEEEEEEDEDY